MNLTVPDPGNAGVGNNFELPTWELFFMKQLKLSLYIGLWFCLICSFFAPFFVINNSFVSIADIVNNGVFNGFFTLNILPFILISLSLLILILSKNNKTLRLINFLLVVVTIILLFFEKYFCSIALNISQKNISFSAGSIFLCIILVAYLIYVSSGVLNGAKLAIRDIVEIGIFVSFAIVLDFAIFKIRVGSTGGSISLVMIPLFILCFRKGFFKGFFATGIVYGLINCLLDGYGFMFYPFDYLLGFGSLAILGLFTKTILKTKKWRSYLFLFAGVLLSLIGRTLAATLSGIIFYNMNFGASLVYQLMYIGPSGGASLVVLILLLPVLKKTFHYGKNNY